MTATPGTGARVARLPGPLLFVRYAYPPNALGYCGPSDSLALREYASAGVVDAGLIRLARQFSGAWPYLQLIAAGAGIADPLDRRVVQAYWVGNPLLDAVPLRRIADSMEERFRRRLGADFRHLADGVLAGAVPHHSFHVFAVYPWVGLLGDDRKADLALTVLDRCRIRWGRVVAHHGDRVIVRSRRLRYDGRRLSLGAAEQETAWYPADALAADPVRTGDWVSLHWDWACERLDQRGLRALHGYTLRHLDLVNHQVARSGALVALDR